MMKRLFLVGVIAFAAAGVVAGGGAAAVDVAGPPCANIVAGGDSLAYVAPGDGTGIVEASLILAAPATSPACANVSYSLAIYTFDGSELLVDNIQPTSTSGDTVFFHYEFTSGAPTDGVCLVGTTSIRGHVIDRAPDSGCAPVERNSSGGFGGWN